MSKLTTSTIHRGSTTASRSRWTVSVIALSALVLAPMAIASGTAAPVLKSANVPGFKGALVTRSSRTLYLLTSEKGAKLKCTGGCLSVWPPLLVKTSVKKISLGAGVKGRIGFVKRSATKKQVTFNSYPVYTYSGDGAALRSSGQGIVAFGGTWYLVKATATSSGTSAFSKSTKSTSSTTTTTSGGGGYGY